MAKKTNHRARVEAAVNCQTCKAKVGESCVSSKGTPTKPHTSRYVDAARAKNRDVVA